MVPDLVPVLVVVEAAALENNEAVVVAVAVAEKSSVRWLHHWALAKRSVQDMPGQESYRDLSQGLQLQVVKEKVEGRQVRPERHGRPATARRDSLAKVRISLAGSLGYARTMWAVQ